ncbi:hypothetical protein PCL_05484 [Purpureocillium lilacinum]|uniref:Uncharacterized protein n=1 Tax=Purpureocillium lilacinum TaxID=33203 RepID=A0A2U3DUS4_PURLI|nr:hypothetical protein PCL_05484 [Purpureocillium lilacinum]
MLACYQVLVLWKWDRDRRTNRSNPSKVCPDGPSKRALGTSCTERLGNASLHQPAAEAFPVLPQRWTVNGILEFWAQPVRQAGTASCVREGEDGQINFLPHCPFLPSPSISRSSSKQQHRDSGLAAAVSRDALPRSVTSRTSTPNCAATKQETTNCYTTFDHRKWRMPQNSSQRDRHRRADDEFLDEDTSSEDASEDEDELLQDDEREGRPPKRGRQAQSTAPATAQQPAITAQSATPSTDPTKMVRLEQQEASRSMGRDNFRKRSGDCG